MGKVHPPEVATPQEATRHELPAHVKDALGELAAAKEGLLALSVGVGLGVLAELMEAEVEEVVGPKGKHDPQRTAKRHGHEPGAVTLGGRRVSVERARHRRDWGGRDDDLRALCRPRPADGSAVHGATGVYEGRLGADARRRQYALLCQDA